MLLKFCCRNKDNKKGRVPSEELDLNLYIIQKYLADTNKKLILMENTVGSEITVLALIGDPRFRIIVFRE